VSESSRLYDLHGRINADGTVALEVRDLYTVAGRDFEGDPRPMTAEDAEAVAFLGEFNAAAVAERDTAVADLAVRTTERDEAQALAESRQATITTLQARVTELEAILNPPDGIYPYQFQRLLTNEQLLAIVNSGDVVLIRMRTDVQTIVTPMPFSEGSDLRRAVEYLGFVLPELFTPGEVARILARTPPE
jgi:hypothetical protein